MRACLLLVVLVGCTRAGTPAHPTVTARLVELADTDGDGTVTAEEFEAGRLPGDTSTTADANGDGIVAPIELEQWFLQTSPTEAQQTAQRANRGTGPGGGARTFGPASPGPPRSGPRPPQGRAPGPRAGTSPPPGDRP